MIVRPTMATQDWRPLIRSHFAILLTAFLISATCQAQNADSNNSPDVPPTEKLLRRYGSSACRMSQWLYIDGGELSVEGQDWRPSDPMNSTLYFNIYNPFPPSNVSFNVIERPENMPVMTKQACATDNEYQMSVWGGIPAWNSTNMEDDVLSFSFQRGYETEGSWKLQTPNNPQEFLKLEATEGSAAVQARDTEFYIGGRTLGSALDTSDGHNVKGFVSYNRTTQIWKNETEGESTSNFSPDDTLYGATASYIPDFGRNGIVVVIGGIVRKDQSAMGYAPMNRVSLMEPVTKKWYTISTPTEPNKMEFPESRHGHCAVVARNSNETTVEIFMFGGTNDEEEVDFGDVWVLSLPQFTWFKAADSDKRIAREGHSCAWIGREFLTFGGLPRHAGEGEEDPWRTPDPFPQTIGVFDLETWEWKDSHDKLGSVLDTHETIKASYKRSGYTSKTWDNDELRAIWDESPFGHYLLTPEEEAEAEAERQRDSQNDEDSGSGGPSAAAIAAGVVSSVVLLAGITGAVWFFLRRRRQKPKNDQEVPLSKIAEMDSEHSSPSGTPRFVSPQSEYSSTMLATPYGRSEIAGTPVNEMSSAGETASPKVLGSMGEEQKMLKFSAYEMDATPPTPEMDGTTHR